jgi:2-oxoacid:acceptor oxidoreductase gamma subunit (pyruvate/2-ketoisovalerate family)
MGNVKEITIWVSGVVQDKEGRDVAMCISKAADREGKFTQAFDNYADLPDRVYVPLRKYARISDTEIEEKYQYENDHPEIVLVMEPTIIKGMNVLHGMRQGGTLVVNTSKTPEDILKLIPNKSLLKRIACVDATKINPQATIDFSGSEGGVDKAGFGFGIGAVMAGAAAKATGCVKLENLEKSVGNPEATRRGFAEVVLRDL